jgi:hypothetical protein
VGYIRQAAPRGTVDQLSPTVEVSAVAATIARRRDLAVAVVADVSEALSILRTVLANATGYGVVRLVGLATSRNERRVRVARWTGSYLEIAVFVCRTLRRIIGCAAARVGFGAAAAIATIRIQTSVSTVTGTGRRL